MRSLAFIAVPVGRAHALIKRPTHPPSITEATAGRLGRSQPIRRPGRPHVVAAVVGALALAGCGDAASGGPALIPATPENGQNLPPAPSPPVDPPHNSGIVPAPVVTETPLVLSDQDALEFAAQALEPYALTTFASHYGVDGCERINERMARCRTTIVYAINPADRQSCTLEITVLAVGSTLGPKPWNPSELEEKNLTASSGAYGDYGYGDLSPCESAYQASSM